LLKASDLSRDRVEDMRTELNEGDEIEAKIVNLDRKNRTITVSVKAKEIDEEKDSIAEHNKQTASAASPATVGDLIKAQMDKE